MRLVTGLTIGMIASAVVTDLLAQAEPSGSPPRLTGNSFAVARYKGGSSASLYVASHVGAVMFVAGGVHQPRNNLKTMVLGVGTRVQFSRSSAVTVIAAGGSSPKGESVRLFALPRVMAGHVAVAGIAATYLPVNGKAPRQAMVDPLTISAPVIGGLRGGLSAMVTTTERSRPDFGLGPSAQLRVPGGALAVELLTRTTSSRPQFRCSFSAAL